MHKSLRNLRFSIKPQLQETERPLEMARTLSVHPLTYQELPYDPEYSQYAGRLTTEKLSNATADEQYWKTKQEVIFRHTGEHPYEIIGPDALKLLQKIVYLFLLTGRKRPLQLTMFFYLFLSQ